MMSPRLQSERFGALGNVVSEGIWNQLGRPELDRLELLVRESVQNSWDARVGEGIDFRLESYALTRAQSATAREFFHDVPPGAAYESTTDLTEPIEGLDKWLASSTPRVLVVSDRGTRGLDGPTRADRDAAEGEERNFVDFLRNVGQPPTKSHGGGTFGYGKAAFYLASETRTILVYTRCRHRGRLEERLSAAALTHHYVDGGTRFTGRHWWGHVVDGTPEPVLDADAHRWAVGMGLPTFDGDECGTTIAVVSPVFSDQALRELPSMCLRNLWPKLRATGKGRPPVSLRLRVSGQDLPVPDPTVVPPYNAFYAALQSIRTGTGDVTDITYRTAVTGRVAFEHALMPPSAAAKQTVTETSEAREYETRPRHIALLRAPEIVVKYLEAGRSIAADAVGFVGVFLADPGEDRAFALSEPPSHDDWQAASVRDERARGIVNQTLRKIRLLAKEFATPHAAEVSATQGAPLARLSSEFADLLPGLALVGDEKPGLASGVGGSNEPPVKRSRSSKPVARLQDNADFEELEIAANSGVKSPCAVFRVDVAHAEGTDRTALKAEVYAVLGTGGREVDGPSRSNAPVVGWWESPRGVRTYGSTASAGPRQQGTWLVVVRVPPKEQMMLGIEVFASREDSR